MFTKELHLLDWIVVSFELATIEAIIATIEWVKLLLKVEARPRDRK